MSPINSLKSGRDMAQFLFSRADHLHEDLPRNRFLCESYPTSAHWLKQRGGSA